MIDFGADGIKSRLQQGQDCIPRSHLEQHDQKWSAQHTRAFQAHEIYGDIIGHASPELAL
jgi:hypothetical protein